jgi:hypothetical protein
VHTCVTENRAALARLPGFRRALLVTTTPFGVAPITDCFYSTISTLSTISAYVRTFSHGSLLPSAAVATTLRLRHVHMQTSVNPGNGWFAASTAVVVNPSARVVPRCKAAFSRHLRIHTHVHPSHGWSAVAAVAAVAVPSTAIVPRCYTALPPPRSHAYVHCPG